MNRLLVILTVGIMLVGMPAQSLAVSGNNTNIPGSIHGGISAPEFYEENTTGVENMSNNTPPVNPKTDIAVENKSMPSKSKPKDRVEVKQFKADYGPNWTVKWHDDRDSPRALYGLYNMGGGALETEDEAEQVALKFISSNSELFKLSTSDLKVKRVMKDTKIGIFNVEYQQHYQGIPVYRGEVGITLSNNSEIASVGNNFYPDINISAEPEIMKEEAVDIVSALTKENLTVNETQRRVDMTTLYIMPETRDGVNYYLTWRVWSARELTYYFIDALDGSVVDVVPTAAGVSVYGNSFGDVYPDRGSSNGSTLTGVNFANELVEVWYTDPPSVPAGSDTTDNTGYYGITVPAGYNYDVMALLDGTHVYVTDDQSNPSFPVPKNYFLGRVDVDTPQDVDWGQTYQSEVYYHVDRAWKWFYDNYAHDQPKVHAHIPDPDRDFGDDWAKGGYDGNSSEYAIWWNPNNLSITYSSDIVLHEYGHTIQWNIYAGRFPGDRYGNKATLEGWPTYYAATINNNSLIGRGPLNIDDDNLQYSTYPHLAFAAALWDIRKAIGAADADKLIWYATYTNPHPDNTNEFFEKLLSIDDNPVYGFGGNSDLTDGTPHSTEIWQAFADHGMDYDTTKPPAPSLNSPAMDAKVGVTKPTFTWDEVQDELSGVKEYRIEIYKDSGLTDLEKGWNVSSTSYPMPYDLTDNKYYYWRVRAIDNAGNEGDWSATRFFKVDTSVTDTSGPFIFAPQENNDPICKDGTGSPEYVTINADIDDTLSGDSNIVSATLYYRPPGAGTFSSVTMDAQDGSFNSPTETVEQTIGGDYTSTGSLLYYITAQDSSGYSTTNDNNGAYFTVLVADCTPQAGGIIDLFNINNGKATTNGESWGDWTYKEYGEAQTSGEIYIESSSTEKWEGAHAGKAVVPSHPFDMWAYAGIELIKNFDFSGDGHFQIYYKKISAGDPAIIRLQFTSGLGTSNEATARLDSPSLYYSDNWRFRSYLKNYMYIPEPQKFDWGNINRIKINIFPKEKQSGTYNNLTINFDTFEFLPDNSNPDIDPPMESADPICVSGTGTPTQVKINTTVDDTYGKGSNIASATLYYVPPGQSTWSSIAMSAQDGAFDEIKEVVEKTIGPFSTPGTLDYYVVGTDTSDNTKKSEYFTVTVDDCNPPDTAIILGPADVSGYSASSSATFYFTSTKSGTFECELDDGGFSACSSPKNYTGLQDGTHTFKVRAIDQGGRTDQTPASYSWTVDTNPPDDTTITATPQDSSNSSVATFEFTSTESAFECQLDGGTYLVCSSPKNYTNLQDGTHTFNVRAVDLAGNKDPTPASYSWTVDTSPPTGTIAINDGAAYTNTASITLTLACSDASGCSQMQFSNDGTGYTTPESYATTKPWNLTTGDGTKTVYVKYKDGAGNWMAAPETDTIVLDTTPPTTTFVHPTDSDGAIITDRDWTFINATLSESSMAWLEWNGTNESMSGSGLNWYLNKTNLADSSYTYKVWANDSVGNLNVSETHILTVAVNHPPVADDQNVTTDEDTSINITLTASDIDGDNLTYFVITLPVNGNLTGTAPDLTYTPNQDYNGPDNFTFKANDGAADSNISTVSLTINAVNDAPVLDFIPDITVNETDLVWVQPAATDPDNDTLTFTFTPPLNSSGAWQTTYDDAGAYTTTVTVSDGTLTDSQNVTITVQNVNRPPVLSPIGNKTVDENALLQFTITASDPDNDALTYTASNLPAGASFTNQTFTWTPTYEQAGTYPNVHFEVSDGLLADFENITITVNDIDITPPTITLSSPLDDSWTNDDTPMFQFTAVDNLAASMSCELFVNGTGHGTASAPNNTLTTITANASLSDGAHSWWVNCTDDGLNTGQSAAWTLNIDTTQASQNQADIYAAMFEHNYNQGDAIISRAYIDNTGQDAIDDLLRITITDSYGEKVYRKLEPLYLEPGEMETLKISWDVPGDAQKGLYKLRVEFDDLGIDSLPSVKWFNVN